MDKQSQRRYAIGVLELCNCLKKLNKWGQTPFIMSNIVSMMLFSTNVFNLPGDEHCLITKALIYISDYAFFPIAKYLQVLKKMKQFVAS